MQPGQAEYNNQTLTEPMINAYTEAFKRFDLDGDGYLSLKELGELLKQMGHPIDQEDLMDMTNEIDIEGNGTIDRKEFLQLMARKIRDFDDEDEYIEAFKIFDRNNDDLISVEEMKEIMTSLTARTDIGTVFGLVQTTAEVQVSRKSKSAKRIFHSQKIR